MICKKVIEVDKVCCDICGQEMPNPAVSTSMSFLHKSFLTGLHSVMINPNIEDSPCCICSDCLEKYEDEIFVFLLDMLCDKCTELKLRSRN